MEREPYTLTWLKPATLRVGLSDGATAFVTLQQMLLLTKLASEEITSSERLVSHLYGGVSAEAQPDWPANVIKVQFSHIRRKLNIRINYTVGAGYWLDAPRPFIIRT